MFYLLCIYTFFVFIRPQEYIPALTGIPLMPILFILMLIGWIIVKEKRIGFPQDKFLIFFLILGATSHVLNFYFGGAFAFFTKFLSIIIIYYFITSSLVSMKEIERFFALIIFLTTIMAVHGILQFNNDGIGWTGQTFAKKSTRIRYIGIFSDPNDLALVFIFAVPLILYFISQNRKLLYRIINIGILSTILYAIYLTQSRGAIVSLGTMIAYYGVKKYGIKKGLIAGAILLIPLVILFTKGQFLEISTTEESAYGRIDAWYEGIQMLMHSPLWGVGPGMFTEFNYLTAHNSFVLCFSETGILGYFFWIGAIYYNFTGLAKTYKYELLNSEEGTIVSPSFFLTISLVGFLAASFFLSRTYTIILYINLGVITSYLYVKSNELEIELYDTAYTRDLLQIAGIVFGSILLIFFFVKLSV